MVKYRSERTVKFINLNGKSEEYCLKEDEKLIDIKCPLDQTFLTRRLVDVGSYNDVVIKCPKCGLDYDNHDLSSENLQYQLDLYLKSFQTELNTIEKDKSKLIKILNFAHSQSKP